MKSSNYIAFLIPKELELLGYQLTEISMFFFSSLWKIRSSVTQLLWAGKEFSWWRHCAITVVLLAFTNVLVIFVPTIRDIFGFIGKHFHSTSGRPLNLGKCSDGLREWCLPVHKTFVCALLTGASAAAMLIFILPSAFYIKLVKKEPMKSVQKIGVCIDKHTKITLAY